MAEAKLGPDCEVGKHGACSGDAYDFEREEIVPCECGCHPSTHPMFIEP